MNTRVNKSTRLILLILGICSLLTIMLFTMGLSIDKPVMVGKSIVDSIYSENNFSYDNYNNYIKSTNFIDYNINKDSLIKVKYLTIDGSNLGNSNFFKYTNNLEVLTIKNYQNLSIKDLKNLSYLKNIKTLSISIDGNYVLKNPNYKIDLNIFPNLNELYITCNLDKEIDGYISYNLIKDNKINNIVFEDGSSIDEVIMWDTKINSLIKSLKLDNMSDNEKVVIVSKYITNHLKYDHDVYNYVLSLSSKDASDKILNYNEKLLSSILDSNKKVNNAICCNYAAFLNVLLYKLGIESYYIIGDVDGGSHAWNLVNVDKTYYFVDLTFLDNNYDSYPVLIANTNDNYETYENYEWPTSNEVKMEPIYYNDNARFVISFK